MIFNIKPSGDFLLRKSLKCIDNSFFAWTLNSIGNNITIFSIEKHKCCTSQSPKYLVHNKKDVFVFMGVKSNYNETANVK